MCESKSNVSVLFGSYFLLYRCFLCLAQDFSVKQKRPSQVFLRKRKREDARQFAAWHLFMKKFLLRECLI